MSCHGNTCYISLNTMSRVSATIITSIKWINQITNLVPRNCHWIAIDSLCNKHAVSWLSPVFYDIRFHLTVHTSQCVRTPRAECLHTSKTRQPQSCWNITIKPKHLAARHTGVAKYAANGATFHCHSAQWSAQSTLQLHCFSHHCSGDHVTTM